jgi:hypothetical protein
MGLLIYVLDWESVSKSFLMITLINEFPSFFSLFRIING